MGDMDYIVVHAISLAAQVGVVIKKQKRRHELSFVRRGLPIKTQKYATEYIPRNYDRYLINYHTQSV